MAAQDSKPAGDAGEIEEIDEATARTQRVLLITVIVLGILLIIGFAIVVATIASRISSSGDEAEVAPEPVIAVTQAGDFEVPVPAGYQVHAVTGDERRLVIHLVSEGQPERIMVVNTRSGQVVRSLVLTPAVP
ncbi:hypothetical protein [Pyruvatibacter sp. HU-CL02332]|mgnify:FL=1|jgi:hypothetical protein|uniref:hypothetical protein n=1 Tax=Pyruvatibacter sp. HU-CL02332 TaxID=3127650 RepID=UPI002967FD95|nr:hypothetical protein [Alphaproteobacteria bacterium]